MNVLLHKLPANLKMLILSLMIVLNSGVIVGLIYLYQTTGIRAEGVIERYNGSGSDDDFEIPETYAKSIEQMLITTHSHVLILGILFGLTAFIFSFNSTLNGRLKTFLMMDTLLSVLLTFGSIWMVRFLNNSFVYLTVLSALIMYSGFFIMSGIILYEVTLKRG